MLAFWVCTWPLSSHQNILLANGCCHCILCSSPGTSELLAVTDAPPSCGYEVNPRTNTLNVPFTGCHVKHLATCNVSVDLSDNFVLTFTAHSWPLPNNGLVAGQHLQPAVPLQDWSPQNRYCSLWWRKTTHPTGWRRSWKVCPTNSNCSTHNNHPSPNCADYSLSVAAEAQRWVWSRSLFLSYSGSRAKQKDATIMLKEKEKNLWSVKSFWWTFQKDNDAIKQPNSCFAGMRFSFETKCRRPPPPLTLL